MISAKCSGDPAESAKNYSGKDSQARGGAQRRTAKPPENNPHCQRPGRRTVRSLGQLVRNHLSQSKQCEDYERNWIAKEVQLRAIQPKPSEVRPPANRRRTSHRAQAANAADQERQQKNSCRSHR